MTSVAYAQTLGRISQSVVRTGDLVEVDVALPAGKDVTAWVKTDANTAACDLPAGHGYSDGNFDVATRLWLEHYLWADSENTFVVCVTVEHVFV
jgi:hypothetical protein